MSIPGEERRVGLLQQSRLIACAAMRVLGQQRESGLRRVTTEVRGFGSGRRRQTLGGVNGGDWRPAVLCLIVGIISVSRFDRTLGWSVLCSGWILIVCRRWWCEMLAAKANQRSPRQSPPPLRRKIQSTVHTHSSQDDAPSQMSATASHLPDQHSAAPLIYSPRRNQHGKRPPRSTAPSAQSPLTTQS